MLNSPGFAKRAGKVHEIEREHREQIPYKKKQKCGSDSIKDHLVKYIKNRSQNNKFGEFKDGHELCYTSDMDKIGSALGGFILGLLLSASHYRKSS